MKTISKLWLLIIVMIILSPLGLMIPGYFKAGMAWGEWSTGEIRALVGYVPDGIKRFSSLWKAPMPGYSGNSFGYIISAGAGVVIVAGTALLIGKILRKKD